MTNSLLTHQDNYDQTSYMPDDRQAPIVYDEDYMRRVDWGIDHLNGESVRNQKKYKKIKRMGIIIGSTIPVAVMFSAFEQIDRIDWLRIPLLVYAAVGGTMLALMNNFLRTGNFYDKWRNYRNMSETLQREKYLYLTRMAPYDGKDAFPQLVEKVEDLLGDQEMSNQE